MASRLRALMDPSKFSGIKKLHIPSDLIWIPDIVLYNNADGEPHISIVSDAIIYFNGLVVWKPPSIYKSFCNIEIEYFPFDTQECLMKFGGWTYNGFLMNISQIPVGPDDKPQALSYPDGREYKYLKIGMDLSAYHPSLEWDLMSVSSSRHEQLYPGCCGQDFYIDITFRLVIRRKTLFFIVNLVIPCMLLAILTVFVFYIPACEHKMTYSSEFIFYLYIVFKGFGKYNIKSIPEIKYKSFRKIISFIYNFRKRIISEKYKYFPENTIPENTIPENTISGKFNSGKYNSGKYNSGKYNSGKYNFRKIQFRKIQFRKIQFRKIQFRKIQFPENTIPENTIPENTIPENTISGKYNSGKYNSGKHFRKVQFGKYNSGKHNSENTIPENIIPENTIPENTAA
ncbi:unnamed protein product [Meloidogyne enterolobii]|uniref:Uncharacterized protein n=1 Tax=Meloidogyne enterolobii TaxID=390850 RepID=A0ACB0Y6R9_MELEN